MPWQMSHSCSANLQPVASEADVTNEELADSAAITPSTASRIMTEWEKVGAISKRRGKVVLHSADKLFIDLASLKSNRNGGRTLRKYGISVRAAEARTAWVDSRS